MKLTFNKTDELLIIHSEEPLKTMSSAMINPGIGYYRHFVNRTVEPHYFPKDAVQEYKNYLEKHHIPVEQTVAMMTAVNQRFAVTKTFQDGDTTVVIVITAGLGNAVDVTQSYQYTYKQSIGTINIFTFIDAKVSDEALMQSYNCLIEAKVKVLADYSIKDRRSNTIATGTSTDSAMIAVTNHGVYHAYGGSITALGALVGKGVATTLGMAIESYLSYVNEVHK